MILSYVDKLWVFRWVRIAHPLWLICFWFVIKDISWCPLPLKNQSEIIEAFSSTSRYLDEYWQYLLRWLNQSNFPPELQLNQANSSDTKAAFLDLHLSIVNVFVSCKIYDKRDEFDFEIVNFPFLDCDIPRAASYGVYISQLIRFARVSGHVTDFLTSTLVINC